MADDAEETLASNGKNCFEKQVDPQPAKTIT
jgi:hypothetical protein